jgi:hypothetical protein
MDAMPAVRTTVHRPRRITLTAGPTAAAEARRQVRAAIVDWEAPVDSDTAVLLTSELVTNAMQLKAGRTFMLSLSAVCDQLRVTVHDTSCRVPVVLDASGDVEAGLRLKLVAKLSTTWGYHRTAAGQALHFTIMPPTVEQRAGRSPWPAWMY